MSKFLSKSNLDDSVSMMLRLLSLFEGSIIYWNSSKSLKQKLGLR